MPRTGTLIIVCSTIASLACADQATNPVDEVMSRGMIAFASTRGGHEWADIYVADRDGSDVTLVTHGTMPAWSWDGQWIAFQRDENPYDAAGIYVARSDGSNERFVGPGHTPAWSRDGRLATVNGLEIDVRGLDGSAFQRLIDHDWALTQLEGCHPSRAAYPAWSPDGMRIAFLLQCYRSGMLYVMNADGSDPIRLSASTSAGPPAWSPDGSSIAAWIDNAITTIDVDSRRLQVHRELVSAQPGIKLDWSPDGRRIVFVAAPSDQTGRRIFELTLATGEVRQLIPIVWVATGVPAFYDDFDVAWARVIQ